MKISALKKATKLIEQLDLIENDIKMLMSPVNASDKPVEFVVVSARKTLRYRPAILSYVEFLCERKRKVVELLTKLGIDVSD